LVTNSITMDWALLITVGNFQSIGMHAVWMWEWRLPDIFWSSTQEVYMQPTQLTAFRFTTHVILTLPGLKSFAYWLKQTSTVYYRKTNEVAHCINRAALNNYSMSVEVETYLLERQNEAVNAIREAFVDIANMQLQTLSQETCGALQSQIYRHLMKKKGRKWTTTRMRIWTMIQTHESHLNEWLCGVYDINCMIYSRTAYWMIPH
jgi:hypothetical protein